LTQKKLRDAREWIGNRDSVVARSANIAAGIAATAAIISALAAIVAIALHLD